MYFTLRKMKVQQLLLLLPTLLLLLPVATYAIGAEKDAQWQGERRASHEQEPIKEQLLVFGTKTAAKSSTQTPSAAALSRQSKQYTERANSNYTVRPTAAAVALAPSNQRLKQYKTVFAQNEEQSTSAFSGSIPPTAGSSLPRRKSQRQQSQVPTLDAKRAEHVVAVETAAQTSFKHSRAVASSANSNLNARVRNSDRSRNTKSRPDAKERKITTTTTTTTTPRPTLLQNLGNSFALFSPNFWNLSTPPKQTTSTTSTTRKPPKKYIPTPTTASLSQSHIKEEKLAFQKPKSRTPTVPTTSASKTETSDGPFKIALPTINFFNSPASENKSKNERDKEKRATAAALRERFNCPQESEVRFQLFPKICKVDKDCSIWNREELCCDIFGAKSCVSGVAKPLEEHSHSPLLGVIPRKCPTRPLAELWWDVQECHTDMDCWPRICCPDGRRRYCRTSQPELEVIPVPVKRSYNYLSEYLECTPPPPPIFDLHPKACTSTLDCFPNVCCQEAGLRHCRPPKKSVLTLMANVLNVDFVRRLTQNIVIK